MQQFIARSKDQLYLVGVSLIVVSFGFFCLPLLMHLEADRQGGLFIANFIIAVGYLIGLKASGRLQKGREGLIPLMLFFILFLISAYSLNREMNVFEESVPWFTVLLIVLCLNYILIQYFPLFATWAQHLSVLLLGISIAAFLYLALYLTPLYLLGAAVFFALGISLHVFVPLLICIFTIKLIRKLGPLNKRLWYSFAGGLALCIVCVTVFSIQWTHTTTKLEKIYRKAGIADHNGLPAAVAVAQQTPSDWITERILKAGLTYASPSRGSGWERMFWGMPRRRWSEPMKHDPLVMIAATFTPPPNFSEEDRFKILEANFDARHQTQERLWSGSDLVTEHVATDVRLWPQFGIAYTEKNIVVTNKAPQHNWGGQQEEAIYSFHLPEGSVITALSLWIEGKEEKAILTSRGKADSAYKAIVGVERRDPSLVHWQEGNTVSVRVFPVLAGQSRRFKLGITAPLIKREQKLVYENIWFEGPDAQHATEDASLEFQQTPQALEAPAVFASHGQQSLTRSGTYDPTWKISLNEQPLAAGSFCFDGRSYSVHPYRQQRVSFNASDIYLDIDRSWTKAEFEYLYDLVKDRNIYVNYDGLVRVTADNRQQLFDRLQDYQYSMFPLFTINDPANALLITKSSGISPNLHDLGDSRYHQELKAYLSKAGRIRLFNFGQDLSPYLKSLKEYRVFEYERGDPEDLKALIDKKHFAQSVENDQQVVIDEAGLLIREDSCITSSAAPDHLMRLFTYNHLMQQVGKGFLDDAEIEDTLVQEAVKAYVVSPVSSLVVLETKKDYERFDIKDEDNSLKNASMKGKGAVPEPHEWALIIIAVFVILTIKFKPQLFKLRAK